MICLGHVSGIIPTPYTLKNLADIFTMVGVPSFFFISGYLYNTRENEFRGFFIRKTKSLLIPFLLLSLLFSVLDPYTFCPQFLIEDLHYPRLSQLSFLGLSTQCQASLEFFLGDILCTVIGISSRATLPLWFVFVLYFATIAYHWLMVKTKSPKAIPIIAVVCAAMAFILSDAGMGSYMKIGPIIMALFFYWLGTVFVRQQWWLDKIPPLLAIGVIIFLLCVLYYLAPMIVNDVFFVNGDFPVTKSISFLACSLVGIVSIVLLFKLLSKLDLWGLDIIKGILRNIARNSLIILAMHYWALVFYRLYISSYIPNTYQLGSAMVFIILVCIISIALFRTRLYMFIGGEKAKQNLPNCLSIK
jgi:fucose 4-O-acetylase-like acetyltransferase